MKIGVLGTGTVGQTLAGKLAELGHDVMIGTRKVADTLPHDEPNAYGLPPFSAWHEGHPAVRLGSFAEAAQHGEMVINATNGAGSLDALQQAGEQNLTGRSCSTPRIRWTSRTACPRP